MQGSTPLHKDLQHCTDVCQVVNTCCTRFYKFVQGCTELYNVVQGCIRLYMLHTVLQVFKRSYKSVYICTGL